MQAPLLSLPQSLPLTVPTLLSPQTFSIHVGAAGFRGRHLRLTSAWPQQVCAITSSNSSSRQLGGPREDTNGRGVFVYTVFDACWSAPSLPAHHLPLPLSGAVSAQMAVKSFLKTYSHDDNLWKCPIFSYFYKEELVWSCCLKIHLLTK